MARFIVSKKVQKAVAPDSVSHPVGKEEAELSLLSQIDELRLKGYSVFEIAKQLKFDIAILKEKMSQLERWDSNVAENADTFQKRREIDLQYMMLLKNVYKFADDLDETRAMAKSNLYKTIKEVIFERSKLWEEKEKVTVNVGRGAQIAVGGNIDNRQFNLLGDVLSGKVKIKDTTEKKIGRPAKMLTEGELVS